MSVHKISVRLHQDRWPHLGCGGWVHLCWLHHLHEPVPWHWNQQAHRKSVSHHGQTDPTGAEEQPPRAIHPQHAPLWQWDMDHLHAPGTPTEHLPHALHEAYPGYQVAGPYTKQRHSHSYWGPFYLLSREPAAPLRWLGNVRLMEDGRILKDVLYDQLASGSLRVGRAALRFKDTWKCDMKACKINTDTWEHAAGDRACWRQKVKQGVRRQWQRAQGGGQKGPQETQRCFNNQHTHKLHLMPCLQQGLPIADWPLQLHKTLQLYKNRGLNLLRRNRHRLPRLRPANNPM